MRKLQQNLAKDLNIQTAVSPGEFLKGWAIPAAFGLLAEKQQNQPGRGNYEHGGQGSRVLGNFTSR